MAKRGREANRLKMRKNTLKGNKPLTRWTDYDVFDFEIENFQAGSS